MLELEYFGELEIERENAREPETCNWWSSIIGLHVDPDVDEDGIDTASDVASVNSDEDNYKKTTLEYNPNMKMDGFNFKLGMEFGSVQLLRNALKEHFIHESKEYKLLANDLERFRAVCRAPGCPYLLYAHVKGGIIT